MFMQEIDQRELAKNGMCEAQAIFSGVAILHRGSPKDGMRQCSLVQKRQWGNEAFTLRVILGNNGHRCITKAFATFFLISLEILKPLQLCDDFQFTSSRWLISCKHRLGLSSKGVGRKMTRIEILGYVDLLVFPADGTKPILPVREVAAVFADSDVAPPVCHVDQFNKWNYSPIRVVLEHNKTLKHTDRHRHRH